MSEKLEKPNPVRAVREKRKLNQREFAELCNMDPAEISRLESGKEKLGWKRALLISQKSGCTMRQLGIDWPPKRNPRARKAPGE